MLTDHNVNKSSISSSTGEDSADCEFDSDGVRLLGCQLVVEDCEMSLVYLHL